MKKLASNCDGKNNNKACPKWVRSQKCIVYTRTGLEMKFLTKRWAQNLSKAISMIHVSLSSLLCTWAFWHLVDELGNSNNYLIHVLDRQTQNALC